MSIGIPDGEEIIAWAAKRFKTVCEKKKGEGPFLVRLQKEERDEDR